MNDGQNRTYINCISLNVKGINNPIKRKKIITYLKKQKTDIAFIQETHLTDIEHTKLKRDWIGKVYYSSFSSSARGVALLINKNLRFQLNTVQKDTSGRFILVDCIINRNRLTLASIYGPNIDDPIFFNKLTMKLTSAEGQCILGGDFNLVLNPLLDRSAPKNTTLSKSATALHQGMNELGLKDVWRPQNPGKKEFSFYSNVHNTYSRIDLFLTSQTLLPHIKTCLYLAATLSDHNALMMEVSMPQEGPTTHRWRFKTFLLKDPDFVNYMNDKLDIYLETNLNTASHSVVWETLKAYMRGNIISYLSHKNKQKRDQLLQLEHEIKILETQHAPTKQSKTFSSLKQKRTLYDNLCTSKAEAAMARTKYHYYEFGNKTSKLLAWQLKQEDTGKYIQCIKTDDDQYLEDSKDINLEFKKYYETLYKTEQSTETEIKDFLNKLAIPKLTVTDRNLLDEAISEEEVHRAIKSLQNNRAPGPDGYPIEYFKTFSEKILTPLTNMIREAFQKETLPKTLELATITLLPKPGKDPQKCSNYRPLSLLNSDYKILSKIIAQRLEKVVPKIINTDQTGFIKNRQGADNVRRLFHIIEHTKKHDHPAVIVSMDAEKAFDRIEPNFLLETMRAMNFGENFLCFIRTLFDAPRSQILTNGVLSGAFSLSRGCRQGCPSSPALFSIAIEPLAIALRSDISITGVKIGTEEHKLALYADDLLVFISQPITSFPSLLTNLKKIQCCIGIQN